MGSRCWVVVSWGTWNDASGASIGVADHCVPTKGPTQVMVETVGAGARKSVCLWDLLGWTVVCHGRLDADDRHSRVANCDCLAKKKAGVSFPAQSVNLLIKLISMPWSDG